MSPHLSVTLPAPIFDRLLAAAAELRLPPEWVAAAFVAALGEDSPPMRRLARPRVDSRPLRISRPALRSSQVRSDVGAAPFPRFDGESHMARLRNPRFAPEFLEKKLSPTLLVPITAAAYARFDDPEPLPDPNPSLPPLPVPRPQSLPILPEVTSR